MVFDSINPATDERLAQIPATRAAEADRALTRAAAAAARWRTSGASERAALLVSLSQTLQQGRERYAQLITAEMGKPIMEARAEIDKCALTCQHYAEYGRHYLADEDVSIEGVKAQVAFLPLGTILAIMPWNYPFWQVFRCAAAALTAGNALLLKHAANVPQTALALAALFGEAGADDGLFQTLLIRSRDIPAWIQDSRIQAVTLTGSERAGRAVAAAAGQALKKSVLELGGSDAFIVLADADLDRAVAAAVASRYQNAGQSCIAAKRFIVVAPIADAFVTRLVASAGALRQGDGAADTTEIGPLARHDLRTLLHGQVVASLATGAIARLGCQLPTGAGSFYPPSVLDHVQPGMRAYSEELFGPVAIILRARDEEHALLLANDNPYGLGGSIWTADRARGERLARRMDSGATFVNAMVKSDPRLPFGGVKASGYGRELAAFGPREFVNVKTLWSAP